MSGYPAHGLFEPLNRPFPDPGRALSPTEAAKEAHRCLYCDDAPCTAACPTAIDVPEFIRKIATGNLPGSARVILDANPLGASCARVCPTGLLCEGACVLGRDESPIRIGDLQRYATDHAQRRGLSFFVPGEGTGRRVAIVGGGPAGLSAARECARLGHEVVVYEAKRSLGGVNRHGIVPSRLPDDVPAWEIEQIVALGVRVRAGVRVGDEVPAGEVLAQADAVLLAPGLGRVPGLGIPGEDAARVWDAIQFIEQVKSEAWDGEAGERVVVVGAGNTAVDAAVLAKRLGAERVTVHYRRAEKDMTAYREEYLFARMLGVEFRFMSMPVRIVAEGDRVIGVEFARTRSDSLFGQEDRAGGRRPAPSPDSGPSRFVPADTVIRANGQSGAGDLFDAFGVPHARGRVVVDARFFTGVPRVFAAGDCVVSAAGRESTVVEAVEQGKRAAHSMHTAILEGGIANG